jgi:hypothetical protein
VAVAKPKQDQGPGGNRQDLRVIQMRPANRPASAAARRPAASSGRGEASAGASLSLTLAFLIAGAIIVAALTFWSGPENERTGISVQPPDSAIPIR